MQTNNFSKSILILRALLIGIFIFHWSVLWRYAVDVPHYDEWQELLPKQGIFSFAWFFKQHNEHWIITTKILNWINYQLFAWNFAYQQIFNFALYGCLLLVYYSSLLKSGYKETVFAPFFIFLLSDLAWENHSWAFQSQFHFYLLFHMLAVRFLTRSSVLSVSAAGWAAFFSLLAIASFSAALAASLLLALALLTRLRAKCDSNLKVPAILYISTICCACAIWFLFYRAPPEALAWSGPWKFEFWKHILTQIALGFGFDNVPQEGWLIGFAITAAGLFLEHSSGLVRRILRNGSNGSAQEFFLILIIFSVLASLAGIALGRSVLSAPQAQASRYAEISGLLLPAFALWLATLPIKSARWALSASWLFVFAAHLDNWNYGARYSKIADSRHASLECALKSEDQICPSAWALPLRAAVINAKELRLNFTR